MTETTERIVESFVRYYLRWFTNSNIKAKGNKEIDILAIDQHGNKFWIECGITHLKTWALKSHATEKDYQNIERKEGMKKAWRHKNSVDYFISCKFDDPKLKEKLKDFNFVDGSYTKIIACWQVKDENVIKYAKSKDIEIWQLKERMKDFIKDIGESHYEDPILRTLQLVKKL
ncbi:MAG: hypothetical protein AABX73_00530 [Nanoarchaeota archaeon]